MHLGVSDLASRAATSIRTISRMLPVETALTFKAWRQRARIILAIDQLSAGRAIPQVAVDVGFGSTAAFSFCLPTSNENDTDRPSSSSHDSG
jgi:transcriptional regulator GlxA family with amidase domain